LLIVAILLSLSFFICAVAVPEAEAQVVRGNVWTAPGTPPPIAPGTGQLVNCPDTLPVWPGQYVTFANTNTSFYIYLPNNFDTNKTYGVISMIWGSDNGTLLPEWTPCFDARNIIFIAPQGAGNSVISGIRASLLLTGANLIKKYYKIDTNRVFLAGHSGGGRMAGFTADNFPDLARGTIQSCGTDFHSPISAPDGFTGFGWYWTPPNYDAKTNVRFVFITGPGDGNYSGINDNYNYGFVPNGYQALMLDVPGMGHEPFWAPQLQQALNWIEQLPDNTNFPPVAINQTVNVANNTAKAITLVATDETGDALTYSVVNSPTNGTVSGSAPNLTYMPATNYVGADSFTFAAYDGTNYSAPATVSIAVKYTTITLTVYSAHGTPIPSGTIWNITNALVNAAVDSPIANGNTQYVATGWSGTGSAGSGIGANASFTITTNSTLTWLWQTNYLVTAIWTSPASGPWTNNANWNPQAPGSTSTTNTIDTATFGNAITNATTITVDTNRNIFSLNFASNSFAYNLTNGSLLLTAGGGIQTSGGGSNHTDFISSPITLKGDATFTANSTNNSRFLSITTNVTGSASGGNTNTLTLNGSNTGTNVINGVISDGLNGGQLALVKSGTGNWLLAGSNTYSGPTTISAGLLRIDGAGRLGGGTYAANLTDNGDFYYNSSANQILSGNISGTGMLEHHGKGKLTLSGTNSYSGGTVFQNAAGTLVIASPQALGTGTLTLLGGTLDATVTNLDNNINNAQKWSWDWTFAGSTNLNLGTGPVTLSGNRTQTIAKNILTVGGVISGTGQAITKSGAGTLVLAGANTYTGPTTVNAGTLLVNGNASANTNTWTVVSGSTLGGTGKIGGVVNYQNGSLASFTVTPMNTPYRNVTYLTFTNAVFMTNLAVRLTLPTNGLANGIYVLATNSVPPTTNGAFATPTIDSGSYGAGGSGRISLNGNNLVLTVSGVVSGPPVFSGISVSGTALMLTVTNGTPNGVWTLLQSTNLALPLSQWATNRMGTYDGSGNLTMNILNTANNSAGYFILK
jgi:autotransporter-associated beta strand protein